MAMDRLEKLRQRRLGVRSAEDNGSGEEAVRTPRLPSRQIPEPPVLVRQRAPLRRTQGPEEGEGDEPEVTEKRTVTREIGRQVVHGQPVRPFRPAARQPEPELEEPEEAVEKTAHPAKVGKVIGEAEALLDKIIDRLTAGQAVIIQRLEEAGQYAVVRLDDAGMGALIVKAGTQLPIAQTAPIQVVGKKKPAPHRAGRQLSAEYAEFLSWWRAMNDKEKLEWCTASSVTWEGSNSALINNMRMSVAVQEYLKVSKYAVEE